MNSSGGTLRYSQDKEVLVAKFLRLNDNIKLINFDVPVVNKANAT